MRVQDEVSSTEKLLDLIRRKKTASEGPISGRPDLSGPQVKLLPSFSSIVPSRKSLTVGVDIGHKNLRLVKTAQLSGKKWSLIDFADVPFGHVGTRDNPQFPAFLRSEVTRFCDISKSRLWAIASAAQFDVRQILIPKVEKKEVENAVFWTLQKEITFEEKETIFDFEVHGESSERGAAKIIVTAYMLPRQEVDLLRKIFSQAGLPLNGVTTTPFAVQNIFKTGWIHNPEEAFASLFIGNNFSRIDIYKNAGLVLTRGIKAGANSMVESLAEEITDRNKGSLDIDEELTGPVDLERARKILFDVGSDSGTVRVKEPGLKLSESETFNMILPALERLIRQVERTFEYYSGKFGKGGIEKIYITSAMNVSRTITDYVGEQLGVQSDIFDPLSRQSSAGGAMASTSLSERIALTPALGAALSDNAHTPNLIYTTKDRKKPERIAFINRLIFVAFIFAFSICAGVMLYLGYAGSQKNSEIERLEKELSKVGPVIDQNAVSQMTEQLRQKRQTASAYGKRYLGMATVAELSLLTPREVRLINLKADFGGIEEGKAKQPEHVEVEGVVLGQRKNLEGTLAGYVMKLNASPLFKRVDIQKSQFVTHKESDLLRFVIDIKLTPGT